MKDTSAPKVKSLYKALRLLDYFDDAHPDAGVTELAAYSGMLKSSVHNILQTFELCGYVTQDSETSRYMLGGAAVSLFSRFKETRRIDYRFTDDGYATDGGEYQDGLYGIAVPVTLGAEPVQYAIGLASDTPISGYMQKQYLSELRYIAKKIASVVGRRW